MRLIDTEMEIAKREAELQKYEERIEGYIAENEPDNIRIVSRIDQCKANMCEIKREIRILKNMTVAYDVDKVVERLEELKGKPPELEYRHVTIDETIKIVREGGAEWRS